MNSILIILNYFRIEIWAEKQGLELAADCHLARIMQTAHLLQVQTDRELYRQMRTEIDMQMDR